MNTSYSLSPPATPVDGNMYYDMGVGQMKTYCGGEWHGINSELNNKKFYWLEDTKLPYCKILNGNWFLDNYDEITQWLEDTEYGTYSPELSSIIFNSDQGATAFQLKWA